MGRLTERLFFNWTDLKPARPLPAAMGPIPDPFWVTEQRLIFFFHNKTYY
jgi:hypothetical protein